VKYWGIFAENLCKTGWSGAGAVSQDLISTGERSELLTRIATTESVLLCAAEKLTAFVELESVILACSKLL
jgi:hypothetical protein